MSWRDDFEAYLTERRANPPRGVEALRTHVTEIFRIFREAISLPPDAMMTEYTTDGIQVTFLFRDGKSYEITIKEVIP